MGSNSEAEKEGDGMSEANAECTCSGTGRNVTCPFHGHGAEAFGPQLRAPQESESKAMKRKLTREEDRRKKVAAKWLDEAVNLCELGRWDGEVRERTITYMLRELDAVPRKKARVK